MKIRKDFTIESQVLVKEAQTKYYEIVRLSKVKYVGNDYVFIDIRFYQREYNDEGEEVYFPSR